MGQLFFMRNRFMEFQILNFVFFNGRTHARLHTRTDKPTDKPKSICPFIFFKYWGIKQMD